MATSAHGTSSKPSFSIPDFRQSPLWVQLKSDLEANKTKCDEKNYALVMKRVHSGYYSDFSSPVASPKLILADHLKTLGLPDLAAKVYTGDYDF